MVQPVDWNGAISLEECVIQYFFRKQTDTDDFKALESYFGKKRIIEIWERYQDNCEQVGDKGLFIFPNHIGEEK